jgi:hypothetical protein
MAAAASAAPTAIRVICQPGIPPATMVRTWTGAGIWVGAVGAYAPSGSGLANAGVAPKAAKAAARPPGRRRYAGHNGCGSLRSPSVRIPAAGRNGAGERVVVRAVKDYGLASRGWALSWAL